MKQVDGQLVPYDSDGPGSNAAFANPNIYRLLEKEDYFYAIRLKGNNILQSHIANLLTRPVGRPPKKPILQYHSFRYQAASWDIARRVVAKIEWHEGELFPRIGFIVTNLRWKHSNVIKFYNKRGTAEQWIKEGKYALKWTRLLVGVCPFGNLKTKIPNKIYPLEQWKKTALLLKQAGVNIIQIGSKEEGPLLPGALDSRDIGYRHTAVVMTHCDAVITHIGGMMHLATAVHVPGIGLFAGVEDPCVSGHEENVNLFIKLECTPCWLEKPCDDPKCKTMLSPEKIANETLNLIKHNSSANCFCSEAIDRLSQ